MATMENEILKFMNLRPESIGIIRYGSGVNSQKGQEKRKPQSDLVVILDNLKEFLNDNKDYDSIKKFLTNKCKSLAQTVKGIFTTGLGKAFKYALEKSKRGKRK